MQNGHLHSQVSFALVVHRYDIISVVNVFCTSNLITVFFLNNNSIVFDTCMEILDKDNAGNYNDSMLISEKNTRLLTTQPFSFNNGKGVYVEK